MLSPTSCSLSDIRVMTLHVAARTNILLVTWQEDLAAPPPEQPRLEGEGAPASTGTEVSGVNSPRVNSYPHFPQTSELQHECVWFPEGMDNSFLFCITYGPDCFLAVGVVTVSIDFSPQFIYICFPLEILTCLLICLLTQGEIEAAPSS